jgi:DNA-binding SARP family transcriptional activator
MEFGLLGPLVVRFRGTDARVPRGNQRALLAALLLDANRLVSADKATEVLWGPAPPPSAPATLRNYVKRLRQALGEQGWARISAQPRGYLIQVGPGELDVSRFETLLAAARCAARGASWAEAAAKAQVAVALWRGEPLADVESEVLALEHAPRLTELRLQALETRIDAELHLGRHADLVSELQQLATAHPLREQIHALLMVAFYRSGRQADALAAYRHARGVLRQELGIEPGTGLQTLHQQILSADPLLTSPEAGPAVFVPAAPGANAQAPDAAAAAMHPPDAADGAGPESSAAASVWPAAVPCQLPGTVPRFTGRAAELARLTDLLDQASGQAPGTVVISAIGGTAGVGKTALAVHWAHQEARRFPDGQLYVNLLGFGPSGTPVSPGDAIRGFLDALGVPADRIPRDLAAQAGLYRSLLADRQILIVLDNARDEQQVRPLLPAGPACMALVTSRSQLAGLAAADGARLLNVDVLSHAEARQLLTVRLGADRAAAEPDAVSEIAGLCARLPLALAVAAARADTRPALPLSALAAELRDAQHRLDALDTGDPAASIRAVFSWSAQQLTPAAARMFRLLGLHPGPDIAIAAAASLAGSSPREARQALTELTRAHLLTERMPGRYAFHDLLRAYAAEQASTNDSGIDGRGAIGRMLDHYLHTAHRATMFIYPLCSEVSLPPPAPGVISDGLADLSGALAWFESERRALLSCSRLAAQQGFDRHAWQLAWAMTAFLDQRGHWHDLAAIQGTAIEAADRLGDTAGRAVTYRLAAAACQSVADYDRARAYAMTALGLYQELGDRAGEARLHLQLVTTSISDGCLSDSVHHGTLALLLFATADNRAGQAQALNALGWAHIQFGDPRRGRTLCRQAVALSRRLGDWGGEAPIWRNLGNAEQQLGHYDLAEACYDRAIPICRELGLRVLEAEALTDLGDTRRASADPQGARQAWQQALAALEGLQHPDTERVRARLSALSPS